MAFTYRFCINAQITDETLVKEMCNLGDVLEIKRITTLTGPTCLIEAYFGHPVNVPQTWTYTHIFSPVHEGVAQFWPGRNPSEHPLPVPFHQNPLENPSPVPFLPPAFPSTSAHPLLPLAPPSTIREPFTAQSEPTPPPPGTTPESFPLNVAPTVRPAVKPFKVQARTSQNKPKGQKKWHPKDFLTIHVSFGLSSTVAINFENTTTWLDEDREYALSEEELAYPREDQLIAGLLFALTEVTATNLALITVKMPINPQIYLEQLTEQQDRHKNWLELLQQFKFKILTAQKYNITPQQKYNNERKRVFVVAPRKLKHNPTAKQLYEEFSRYGTVDHIRPAQSRDGTLACIYVRFAYEQSAVQMVRNGALGAQFADPFSFADPTYNPYISCSACNLEIEKIHREYHDAICEMQRFDPGAFLPHEPPQN